MLNEEKMLKKSITKSAIYSLICSSQTNLKFKRFRNVITFTTLGEMKKDYVPYFKESQMELAHLASLIHKWGCRGLRKESFFANITN